MEPKGHENAQRQVSQMGSPRTGPCGNSRSPVRPSPPGHDMITNTLIKNLAQHVCALVEKSDVLQRLPTPCVTAPAVHQQVNLPLEFGGRGGGQQSGMVLGDAPTKEARCIELKPPLDVTKGVDMPMSVRIYNLRKALKCAFGTITEAFAAFDVNQEGTLSYQDFRSGLEALVVPWQTVVGTDDLRAVFTAMDASGTGRLVLSEFNGEGIAEKAGGNDQERENPTAATTLKRQPWSCRQPMKTAAGETLIERPVLSRPRNAESGQRFDPQGMWKKSREAMEERHIWLQTMQDERRRQEMAELLPPSISAKARKLGTKDDRPRPGTKEYNEQYQRKPTDASPDHFLKEMAACTFTPQLNARSRNIFRQTRETGEAWHERLQREAVSDRLRSAASEHEKECSFTPRINSRSRKIGQRTEPGMVFDKLYHERRPPAVGGNSVIKSTCWEPGVRAVVGTNGGTIGDSAVADSDTTAAAVAAGAATAEAAAAAGVAVATPGVHTADGQQPSWMPDQLAYSAGEAYDHHLPSTSEMVTTRGSHGHDGNDPGHEASSVNLRVLDTTPAIESMLTSIQPYMTESVLDKEETF